MPEGTGRILLSQNEYFQHHDHWFKSTCTAMNFLCYKQQFFQQNPMSHNTVIKSIFSETYRAGNLHTNGYQAYLSIKKPPKKQRTTFGHEYHEYRYTNSDVVNSISLIKLSCKAPGIS